LLLPLSIVGQGGGVGALEWVEGRILKLEMIRSGLNLEPLPSVSLHLSRGFREDVFAAAAGDQGLGMVLYTYGVWGRLNITTVLWQPPHFTPMKKKFGVAAAF